MTKVSKLLGSGWGQQTYVILLRVANLHPQNVIQQPVDGLVFVEHEEELGYHREVSGLKHLTWKKNKKNTDDARTKPLSWFPSAMLCGKTNTPMNPSWENSR